MLKNFLTVGSWTMLSRILGLIRDQMLAAFVGAGPAQDAYQVAVRLPNMFRSLFGEGAFNATFVPMFTERLTSGGRDHARAFASDALSCLTAWLLAITILGEVFMPWVIGFIGSGFGVDDGRFPLAVSLTRITFPYLLMICTAALVAGVLNGLHRFALASAAYVAFNVVGIAAILLGAFVFHDVVHTSAWGVTLSGVIQFGLLFWSVRRAGIRLRFVPPRLTRDMKAMLGRLVPGLVGSGVTQLNLTVDTMIATWLPTGSISWLYFADRVNQLPLGVLGAAAGTTLLPVLTRHVAQGDTRSGREALNRAIDYASLLTLPAAFGLIALAPEIMATLFGYGRFTTEDALLSSQSLRAYAIGLPAFVLIKVLAPGFFSHGDTRTPVRIGFFTLALNLALNLMLYRPLAHIGPPLASALAALVNMTLLGVLLYRRGVFRPDTRLIGRFARMVAASAIMAIVTLGATRLLAPGLVLWHGVARALMLGFLMGIGGATYLGCLTALGIGAPSTILARLRRR